MQTAEHEIADASAAVFLEPRHHVDQHQARDPVGAGLIVPASLSLLLAAVPAQARARAIGTWSAIGALGAALGPVIGGLLVQLSWRWVFWINLPVALFAGLAARWLS